MLPRLYATLPLHAPSVHRQASVWSGARRSVRSGALLCDAVYVARVQQNFPRLHADDLRRQYSTSAVRTAAASPRDACCAPGRPVCKKADRQLASNHRRNSCHRSTQRIAATHTQHNIRQHLPHRNGCRAAYAQAQASTPAPNQQSKVRAARALRSDPYAACSTSSACASVSVARASPGPPNCGMTAPPLAM